MKWGWILKPEILLFMMGVYGIVFSNLPIQAIKAEEELCMFHLLQVSINPSIRIVQPHSTISLHRLY